jgi:hypothetical protein
MREESKLRNRRFRYGFAPVCLLLLGGISGCSKPAGQSSAQTADAPAKDSAVVSQSVHAASETESPKAASQPSASSANAEAQKAEIRKVFHQEIAALNRNDFDSYMATIDKDSSIYGDQGTMLHRLFKLDLKLKYEIDSLDVKMDGPNAATATLVETVRKTGGSGAFRNNRTTSVNHLVFKRNCWLLASGEMKKFEAVD